jgi:hypothetical protein
MTAKYKEAFKFSGWEDRSPDVNTLHYLSVLLLTRLRTNKVFEYSTVARKKLGRHEKWFIKKYNTDTHFDFIIKEEIPNHKYFSLVYNSEKGVKPWFANQWLMHVLDLFFLGWIQRWALNSSTKVVEYKIVKKILY